MDIVDAMNQVVTPDAVMWAAAGASLLLLVLVGPVRSVFTGGRRDAGFRAVRILLVLVLLLTVALPLVLLLTGEAVSGLPCACLFALFPLFCYYLGKGVGYEKGRGGMADLVGLADARDIEDAQDRLYESRLRLASRDAVIASIAHMTRSGSTAPLTPDPVPETGDPVKNTAENAEILDVLVEEV